MILIIISLILAIITAVVICIIEEEANLKMLFSLGWLVLILFGCFKSVKTGEVGIKTRFGKITDTYLKEGINFKLPFEKIDTIDIKVQKYENEVTLETSTKDMQVVNAIRVSINYQIDEKETINLYRKVGKNYKEVILEPAIQEAIKGTMSKYTSEELIVKRSEVAIDMQETLNKKIEDYGINVIAVSIKNFNFSEEYNASIEKKAIAEQEVLTAQQELEKAKVESEKKLLEAETEAKANKIKEKTLTKEVLQQQFIEKWNGELPKATGSNNILDISNFIK